MIREASSEALLNWEASIETLVNRGASSETLVNREASSEDLLNREASTETLVNREASTETLVNREASSEDKINLWDQILETKINLEEIRANGIIREIGTALGVLKKSKIIKIIGITKLVNLSVIYKEVTEHQGITENLLKEKIDQLEMRESIGDLWRE